MTEGIIFAANITEGIRAVSVSEGMEVRVEVGSGEGVDVACSTTEIGVG